MIVGILKRLYNEYQTLGKLVVRNNRDIIFVCDTIELPDKNNARQISCIPCGVYKVAYRESPKYPQHYHILDVPNRDYILIHQANYVGSKNPRTHKPDLLGCIGVGNGYYDLNGDNIVELTKSTPTLKAMIKAIGKNDWTLKIE